MIFAIVTLLILSFTLFIQYRRYGIKIILHPSTYFLSMWILSIISFILFYLAGLDLIIYEDYLNELFLFISVTALSFIYWGRKNNRLIKRSTIRLDLYIPDALFRTFVIFFLIISLISIFQTGFDVARNREVANNELFNNSGNRSLIFTLIPGIIYMLSLPFTVYSGFKIGSNYVRGIRKIAFLYYLPVLTTVLETVAGGGRAAIVSSVLMFIIGFALGFFSFPLQNTIKQSLRPLIKYAVLFFILFSIYSGFVSSQRSLRENADSNSRYVSILLNKYPLLTPVSGTLEYLVFHFQGYQWRREDKKDSKLEWGKNTFACVTQFNVPVISQLTRHKISIENLFGLEYADGLKATQEAKEANIIGFSITATVYYVLYKDFGFWGTLFMIFIFVGITQKIFEQLFFKNNYNFWSIIFFLAIYKLWTQTFFSHHLNGAWFNGFLYPIFIIEVLNKMYRVKNSKPIKHSA